MLVWEVGEDTMLWFDEVERVCLLPVPASPVYLLLIAEAVFNSFIIPIPEELPFGDRLCL